MLHPHTQLVYINAAKNRGVIATQFIPKGTLIWVMSKEDKVFTPQQIKAAEIKQDEEFIMHAYRDNQGNYIYSTDIARFINHSSNSNCLLTPYQVEIAIRDIERNEELTCDYGAYNIIEPFKCEAEEGCQRDVIFPDDLLHYHSQWDAKLWQAFKWFSSVDQPLAYLLNPDTKVEFEKIAQGKIKPLSILHCYYTPDKNISHR